MSLKKIIAAILGKRERNETNVVPLEDTAARLTRARFTSEPPRAEFQAKLLERLLRERRNQPVPMIDRTSRSIVRLIHSLSAVPIVASVLVVAVFVSSLAPFQGAGRRFSELLIPAAYASDNFSVDPTAGDRLGIASSTSFVITSKLPVKREDLQRAMKIVPAIEYDMAERSSTEFVVTPRAALAPRTLYRIMIDSSVALENGITVARPFSFAFEVKERVRVMSSVPGDKTNAVPVGTAIEFSLTHDGFKNAPEAVRVSPSFKYAVETKGRKIIIKPQEKLKYGTIYTVTLGKNLAIAGTNDTLADDYAIAFETERVGAGRNSGWYLGEREVEFSPSQKPALPVYGFEAGKGLPKARAIVYRFPAVEAYAKELERFEQVPYWSWIQQELYRTATTSLKEYGRFDLQIEKTNYDHYLNFPAPVAKGWYVADITIDGVTRQLLFQVTPWGVYSINAAGKAVVWINDLVKKAPGSQIALTTVSGTTVGTTDAQGLATIDTAAFPTSTNIFRQHYVVAGAGSDAVVVALSSQGGYQPYTEDDRQSAPSDYWQYLATDRDVYQIGDHVNVWGFVKPRRASVPDATQVRVKLLGNGSDWYGNELVIFDKTLPLVGHAFSTDFSLTTLGAGYYAMQVFAGDTLVASRYIRVESYEKPVLTLKTKPSARAIEAGKPFTVTVAGTFFDGTPASRVRIAYEFQETTRSITLDDAGQAVIALTAPFASCAKPGEADKVADDCYFPREASVSVRTEGAEYGDVSASETVSIFGANVYLREAVLAIPNSHTVEVSTTLYSVDIAKAKDAPRVNIYDYYGSGSLPLFLGKSVPGALIEGILKETEYVKVVEGMVYNAYTKQMEERYSMVASTSIVQRFSERTASDGRLVKRFTTKPDFKYDLYLRSIDQNGFPEYSHQTFYGQNPQPLTSSESYYLPYGGISLQLVEKDKKFLVGEQVKTVVKTNDDKALTTPGTILYLRSNGRYLVADVRRTADYSFTFTDEDVPSTYMAAARFDGSDYETMYGSLVIPFHKETRALSVVVKPTKDSYAPGEQATVAVSVRDTSGGPVVGAVNLNIVDEAYYAYNPEVATPLETLYTSLGNPFSQTRRTHEFLKAQSSESDGGRGGCFLEGTRVLMADGTERSIESIKAGDVIKTFGNPLRGTYVSAAVERTYEHVVSELIVVNKTLRVTPEHRLFINSGWQTIGSAKVGDVLISAEGRPVTITSLDHVRGTFKVYNLSIKDYHTFIAGGYFVHNDKDGDRTNFVDTAATLSGFTNAQGEAVFTFKLPDNITSWRATAQAITEKLQAGVSTTPVIATKPVFVQPNIAPGYVAGDKPLIGFQAYGTALKASDIVQLGFGAPSLGVPETTIQGAPFTPRYVQLPELTPGSYQARFTVASARGNDGVKLPINVSMSRQRETVETLHAIQPGTRITGNGYASTHVTVMDKERGSLYAPLLNLSYASSDRLDDRLAQDVSINALKTYFNEMPDAVVSTEWTRYQTANRGLALLPYGGNDPYLAMLASGISNGRLDSPGLTRYWYDLLANEATPREQVIQALVGLAALGEPVLLPIRSMGAVKDLSLIERSYLALAASSAGDEQMARSLYRSLTDESSVLTENARSLKGIVDEELVRQTAGSLAIVGARLNDPMAEEWVRQLDIRDLKNPSSHYALEEALYITARLPNLKGGDQTFSVVHGDSVVSRTLTRGQSATFDLTASEGDFITFGTSTGNIVAVARTERPVQVGSGSVGYGVRREYLVGGVPTTTFAVGDLVEVRLYPEIPADRSGRSYELSDIMPSGLAYLGRTYSWFFEKSFDCRNNYPYAVDGQEVKFFVYGDWNKIQPGACANLPYMAYKARVRGPGTYVAEPSLLQSFDNANIRGYGAAGTVIIATSSPKLSASDAAAL